MTIPLDELAPISQQVWRLKYRHRHPDGSPAEASVADSWRRVAVALAAVEADPATWRPRFEAALEDFRFLPGGRILAGAGTDRDVTLFNCFVMGTVPDDLGGIFTHLREAALTMQKGGGIGYDFSTLRPHGALVRRLGADASGPISYMDVWDAMCRTISSAGSRRGAMMATLRVDHPDIEAFIDAKRTPGRLSMFNLSVTVSDDFMRAVADDAPWELRFGGRVVRSLSARALWDRIMRATYTYAEPGVIFIDRINARNNLAYCERIAATNPCGEQPLPPYGACLLGSVNLARLVEYPFSSRASLNEAALAAVVPVAVRMLDNAIDASKFPLAEQEAEAGAKRRIGLGVTGLADALAFCNIRYGSGAAVDLTERWLRILRDSAYRASVDLAAEKGAFPLFEREAYLAAPMIRDLPGDIRDGIARHGIRNALLTSIAPTGTISLLADNVSSGIEPIFALEFNRAILDYDGSARHENVCDHAYRLFRRLHGDDAPLPAGLVTAMELSPEEHLVMQAAAQKYVDSAISKTINVPVDIPFEQFRSIYWRAYELGCKGCTTYRPNEITGAVLSTGQKVTGQKVTAADEPHACPSCGEIGLIEQEGCAECLYCGYSRC
jgi:ribonucleoside-diphosphate reductase alpha chain